MMALEVSVTVGPGLQAWIDRQKDNVAQVPALLSKAVRITADDVVNDAKRIVPVASGALSRSISATFFFNGLAAVIGCYLPYAARQEYDATLQHTPPKTQQHAISRGPNKGRLTHPTNTNPEATWGFLRKSLAKNKPAFLQKIQDIADRFK